MSPVSHESITRRRVLGLAAGATLGTAALDSVGADSADAVRLNVGYTDPSGKRAATARAEEVVYEFGFDAVTILAPGTARETLADRSDVRYAERDAEMRAIGLDGVLPTGILGGPGNTDDGDGDGDGDEGHGNDSSGDNGSGNDGRGSGDGGGDDDDDGDDGDNGRGNDGSGGGSDGGGSDGGGSDGGGSDGGGSDGGGDGGGGDGGGDSGRSGGGSTCQTGSQPYTWGIDRVDADVAHANCATGTSAHVAIIDTGIDRFHSDLKANLGEGVGFVGGARTPYWHDDAGHGTHVAGTAAAIDSDRGVVGIAPEAKLHAVKVLQTPGVGLTSDVAKGIEWTDKQGYDVGNMSLGGGDSDLLEEACNAAADSGVLLVAAAGNAGECEDCVSFPAAYDSVVAVSATACKDSLAGFSSTGPEVELAAPGEAIYSTFTGSTLATNTYATLSGTSMASPHVAGAGAQLMAAGYDNENARDRLANTAEDLKLTSTEQGNGLVDVADALGYDSSDDGTGNGPNC